MAASVPPASEGNTYDAVGNGTASPLSASYGYQPFNRLTATFSYDNNGDLVSKTEGIQTTQYVWDSENRLSRVSSLGSQDVWYKYDALGRRIERDKGIALPIPLATETTRFVHDGADVTRDLNVDGTTAADYVNGPGIDNKFRQIVAGTASYLIQDHLGTTCALTDATGNINSTLSYDSFGNVSSGSSSTRYTYTGREFDSDTGLIYYRARWYIPQMGRFISEDPIRLSGGMNLFIYAANNPTRFIDPTGTQIRSDRNWYEGEKDPITGETLHNNFRQAAGMACALDGFNPWVSLEAGGGFHLLSPTGVNGAVAIKFNFFTMETCFYVRTCVRAGFGIYAGGGLNGGFNFGPSEGHRSRGWSSPHLAGDVAVPGEAGRLIGRGGSGNLGLSGLGVGAGPTLGAGASIGTDFCYTRLVCYNSPKCSCNSR